MPDTKYAWEEKATHWIEERAVQKKEVVRAFDAGWDAAIDWTRAVHYDPQRAQGNQMYGEALEDFLKANG